MLSVLSAREALSRINELALGFGSLDKQAANQRLFELRKAATIERREAGAAGRGAYRPRGPEELAALAGGDVRVVMTPGPKTATKARKTAPVASQGPSEQTPSPSEEVSV